MATASPVPEESFHVVLLLSRLMNTVTCPTCADSSHVQIAASSGAGTRWRASCSECGDSWDLPD